MLLLYFIAIERKAPKRPEMNQGARGHSFVLYSSRHKLIPKINTSLSLKFLRHYITLTDTRQRGGKDTAQAWLIPRKNTTHLKTLDHSLSSLWGFPSRMSVQGYIIPTKAAAVPEDGAIHHTALNKFAIIPKSIAWIRLLLASGNTENMNKTIAKKAPRINNTIPRTKTFTTDGAIRRQKFRKNCPLEGERLPQSKHCIVNPIRRWIRRRLLKMFVQFIQEGNRFRWTVVDGLWVAWWKTDQSQASKYLVGKGRNQMTFLPRTSQSERVLQPARLASDWQNVGINSFLHLLSAVSLVKTLLKYLVSVCGHDI